MTQFGQDLKHERELRGITLKEIADATRISLRYLEALEADRLDVLPGKFFVRAILRSYARAVGLDEAPLLKRYDELTQFNEQLEYKEAGTGALPARPRSRKWPPAAVFTPALVIAAVLLYVFVLAPRKAARPPVKAKTGVQARIPAAPAETTPAPVTTTPATPRAPAAEEIKGLRLDVTFAEDVWLQVYADGQLVWDGIKTAGESLQVKAEREVVLNTGNAGGMSFLLNGKPAKPVGPHGAVVRDVRITLENSKEFLLPEGAG